MSTSMRSTIRRMRRVWSEIDYAQRRLLAIRTGIDITAPERRSRRSALPAGA